MDHQPKTREFVKSLSQFFKRDLISVPLIKKYPHQQIGQRCQLRAATLELDTAAYPNIEYIAGNRLSVYPVNPHDQVESVMKHVIDDISPLVGAAANHHQHHHLANSGQQQQVSSGSTKRPSTPTGSQLSASSASGNKRARRSSSQLNQNHQPQQQQQRVKMSEPWAQFVLANGKDSVRLALAYLYDITTAPSRDLLRVMAEACSNREHKNKLIALSRTDEVWEQWLCQTQRTLKSTLDEFHSCSISAKSLFSELHLQQPRQYSISSIKSNKRFRTEIIVVQHRFDKKHIVSALQVLKERERMQQLEGADGQGPRSPLAGSLGPLQTHPTTVHVNHRDNDSSDGGTGTGAAATGGRSLRSVRSLRPMTAFSTSPISSQQVRRVPSYSGPLMSMYALSSSVKSRQSLTGGSTRGKSLRSAVMATAASRTSDRSAATSGSNGNNGGSSKSQTMPYEGLCSSYLLGLQANDYIVCELVENPRFTLKGNRERPIMMIGQDVGLFAYRTFWQQRALEHDRAQVFYTLFKDLMPKKFGEMQLVYLAGHRCKFEDLFKREISASLTSKILSSVSSIQRQHLHALLDSAATTSQTSLMETTTNEQTTQNCGAGKQQQLPIDAKELIELGNRMYKLLIENNGCLYTCCDPQMTQAIEILLVESIARNNNSLGRDKVMALLPKWKGRRLTGDQAANSNNNNNSNSNNNKFLFTLENPFERAQIVQEIYDSIN